MTEKLAENRNVTLILRLVVNPAGELLHGELVNGQAQPWGRFVDLPGLTQMVLTCLASQRAVGAHHDGAGDGEPGQASE